MAQPKKIWNFLMDKIGNAYGVAGLMGNLYAESGLNPINLQNSYEKKLDMTDSEYTAAVDNGTYTREQFIHDSAGYGLAQWTYWARKQNMYDYIKNTGASIGDLDAQLDFLWKELSAYTAVTSVLFKAQSVREASDVVLLKYEKPANQTEENLIRRAGYGEVYYIAYTDNTAEQTPVEAAPEEQPKPAATVEEPMPAVAAEDAIPEKQDNKSDWDSDLYPIEKFIMTKNRCYKANKRRVPTGIQVHSVGCKGTTRDRWRRWDDPAYSKCPNAFIDLNGIMQCLDWDVRPWLSGSGSKGNANDWCVGFEICEPSTSKDTPIAAAYLYGCVKWLCVQLCKEYGIHPSQIKCHCELHKERVASNHADVNHWWGKKGTSWEQYTMTRLRYDVANELGIDMNKPIINIEAVVRSTVKRGSTGTDVMILQQMLNSIGYVAGPVDGKFGKQTLSAVKSFQKQHKLKVDGVVGKDTWTALNKAALPAIG